MALIEVNHNVEMGHRLSRQPDSRCFHLHGHSWRVFLRIAGPMDPISGMVMDFGPIKSAWRGWLDDNYDHHLLLNPEDPLIVHLLNHGGGFGEKTIEEWGITLTDGCDPTVENFAKMNYHWAKDHFQQYGQMYKFHVKVFEAASNAAEYGEGV